MSALLPVNLEIPFIFFPGNSTPVVWSLVQGLTWFTTKQPVDDASGTLSILDSNGTPEPGATNISFATTATVGEYIAVIDGTMFAPEVGTDYTTIIAMTSPKYGAGTWAIPTIIRLRTSP